MPAFCSYSLQWYAVLFKYAEHTYAKSTAFQQKDMLAKERGNEIFMKPPN